MLVGGEIPRQNLVLAEPAIRIILASQNRIYASPNKQPIVGRGKHVSISPIEQQTVMRGIQMKWNQREGSIVAMFWYIQSPV